MPLIVSTDPAAGDAMDYNRSSDDYRHRSHRFLAANNFVPALLRLDGDWYESTKICLEMLFPQTSSGGIVVIDDYGRWPGCRHAVDEFLSRLDRPLFLHHIDATGRYLMVP